MCGTCCMKKLQNQCWILTGTNFALDLIFAQIEWSHINIDILLVQLYASQSWHRCRGLHGIVGDVLGSWHRGTTNYKSVTREPDCYLCSQGCSSGLGRYSHSKARGLHCILKTMDVPSQKTFQHLPFAFHDPNISNHTAYCWGVELLHCASSWLVNRVAT